MVVGISICTNNAISNGAIVASLNHTFTRFFAQAVNALSDNSFMSLTTLCHNALQRYSNVNGQFPKNILIYRRGVDEGQLKTIYEIELPQIKSACKLAGGVEYKPNLAFIIVNSTAKLYLTIDDSPPDWYQFYVVSQSMFQSTISPTAFTVIYDKSGLLPAQLQEQTYKLTFLFKQSFT